MIETVKRENYGSYGIYNEQNRIENTPASSGEKQHAYFDIKTVLDKIGEYTYTEKDVEAVDKGLVEEIKNKFNVSAEDVYELYSQGVDLDQLRIQEVSYYEKNTATTHTLGDTQSPGKEDEKDKSLAEKIQIIKEEHNSMYINTLLSGSEITINQLYANNFKGEPKKGITNYTKEDVSNVLKLNGIEENSSSMWAANMLMMYDMGVNASNITKLQNMQSAVGALNIQETGNVEGDTTLVSDEGVNYSKEYIDEVKEDLKQVQDEDIEELIKEGKEINIDELRESIHKKANEALRGSNAQQGDSNREENKEQAFGENAGEVQEVKRQILQITAKLTAEAAQKISSQMPLESSSLAAVASALHQLEMDMAQEALDAAQLPVTEENIQMITEAMAAKENIDTYFMETVDIELRTDGNANLKEIQEALAKYEANETPVERRFGETLASVAGQVEGLLERQGIEVTAAHVEAAKALIACGYDVTAANIQNVEDIVLKVNSFLQEMTPMLAAQMIKEGINPYHSSIDQILSYVGEHKAPGLKNSVAEAIVTMEHNGEISEEQKEGLIGLYRILQAVEKDKSAVMGYLFRNELPLTIENLQIAAKYVKAKNGIAVTVDDHFGERERFKQSSNSARQMLAESVTASKQTEENIRLLENMELPITEANINKVSKMSAILYPYIKEQFKKTMDHFDGINSLPESFVQKIVAVQNASPELIDHMLKQEMPLTLNNIYWMDKIMGDPTLYGELLDENGMLKKELPSDLEEMEDELLELEKTAKLGKEEAVLRGDYAKYKQYKQVEEMVCAQKQLIDKEGLYQIPFMIDGERKLINLYLYDEKNNHTINATSHLKAMITYQTKNLGNVKAYLEIKGDQLGFKIEAEHEMGTKRLEAHKEKLLEGLLAIGYHAQYSSFVSEQNDSSQPAEEKKEAILNEDSNFEVMI